MSALLTTASVLMCPHGGSVSITCSNTKASAGTAVARTSDTFVIAGCAFAPGGVAHPCLSIQWVVSANRVKAAGDLALNMSSIGLCKAADGAPQGTVLIQNTQQRVSGQ